MGIYAALGCAFLAGCASDRPPEEWTDDGLVRVPSQSYGGVYRSPEATFHQYQRVILEPPSVGFVEGWRKKHPEVSDADIRRIRKESVELFREQFAREFVDRGPYQFADAPAPDVLLVSPAVEELDIVAPNAGVEPGTRTYTPGPVKMKLSGELRDAVTGKVLARLIMYQAEERYAFGELRDANRVTNAHEQRLAFAKWVRLAREALNVAKAERPRADRGKPAPATEEPR